MSVSDIFNTTMHIVFNIFIIVRISLLLIKQSIEYIEKHPLFLSILNCILNIFILIVIILLILFYYITFLG